MPSVTFTSSYSVSYWGAITASVRLTFSESYNQNTNQTTLALTGIEFKKNGSANVGQIPVFGSIYIDNQLVCTINNSSNYSNVSLNGDGWCSASLPTRNTVTVTHNADGTKNVTIAVVAGSQSRFCAQYSWYHQTGTDPSTGHPIYRTTYVPFGVPAQSATMALTTRPRISSVSATNADFGSPVTITLNRHNSAFTHTVKVTCAGQTDTLMTKGSTYPTLTWTPSVSRFAPLITNSKTATATIVCETYNGDVLLGTSSTTCTLTFLAADVGPSVSMALTDPEGKLAVYGKYVKAKSKITVTLTPSLQYGATVAAINILANNASFNTSPATTDFILSTANTSVSGTITDSRGFTATVSETIDIYDYDQPQINAFVANRCKSDGTEDNEGAYFIVAYDISVSPIGNQNSKTITIKYKKKSDSSYTTAPSITPASYSEISSTPPIAADTDSAYNIIFELADDFGTTSVELSLPVASTRVNFRSGKNGGIAIGKVCEYDKTLEIADGWTLKLRGKTLLDLIYPVGSIFMSVNNVDPSGLLGGTWERITGKFLLAATDNGAAGGNGNASIAPGNTGGEATHTLSVNEMPSHNHAQSSVSTQRAISTTTSGATNYIERGSGVYYTATLNNFSTGSKGGSGAHNNMPPYLAVYVWKRTA